VLAIAAVALAACAVQARVATAGPPGHTVRVGFLENLLATFDPAANPAHRELVEGLRELGYTPGRDVVVEFKSAEGNIKLWPELAAGLVSSKPDMLVTPALGPTLAAAKTTKTIPIVMVGATDVVETGLVASLARPGGNITGLAINAAEIAAKRVQLLQEAVPNASRIAVLWNATLPGMALGFQNIDRASPQLGVTIQSVRVSGSGEFVRRSRQSRAVTRMVWSCCSGRFAETTCPASWNL
jgi:putative ABC transport system substrate-binding protein